MIDAVLNFASRKEMFDVFAFDGIKRIACVERLFADDERPYKVILGFGFIYDFEYEEMRAFDNKDDAYKYYLKRVAT